MTNAYEMKCEKCGLSVADGAALKRTSKKGDRFKGECIEAAACIIRMLVS